MGARGFATAVHNALLKVVGIPLERTFNACGRILIKIRCCCINALGESKKRLEEQKTDSEGSNNSGVPRFLEEQGL